jgi:drug/metabolite transporter (DMT)-like permease
MSNPPSDGSDRSRGFVIALISAAILSTSAIFIRYLTQSYQIPALVLAFWRDAFVAVILLPVLAWLRPHLLRLSLPHLLFLSTYALVVALFNSLWILSVSLNGAAVSTVLGYSSAAFTALLGRWWLQERLDRARLLAVCLSLGGCVLVSGALQAAAWQANWVGILAGLLSGLAYSLYTLMGRAASQRGLDPWTTILYTFGLAAVLLLLVNLLPGEFMPGKAARPADLLWLGGGLGGWSILLLLAAGPTLVGFGLYNVSLGYLPSSVVNLIVTVEPVFTAVSAYALLGERMNGLQIGGSAMILAGVVLLRIGEGTTSQATQ